MRRRLEAEIFSRHNGCADSERHLVTVAGIGGIVHLDPVRPRLQIRMHKCRIAANVARRENDAGSGAHDDRPSRSARLHACHEAVF